MEIGLTEMVADDRAPFTETVPAVDVTVTGELELSVTWRSNDQDPTVVRVPVEMDDDDVQGEELPKAE